MTPNFFIPQFKEIANKVKILADCNVSLKSHKEMLESKLEENIVQAKQELLELQKSSNQINAQLQISSEKKIVELQLRLDQTLAETESRLNAIINKLEAEKIELEASNIELERRLLLVLKRLESLS